MWIEFGAILLAVVVGYVVYVLFWNTATPGLGGSIDDYIIQEDNGMYVNESIMLCTVYVLFHQLHNEPTYTYKRT